jgi:NADH:ubiquinone oxidoreductase subunit F (NADH-binding)
MLESLEGKRGMVRPKPPIPALSGLFGKPTLVHNVMTLASVPRILAEGATAYQAIGNERSRGTSVFQLAGNVARGGIVELPFGVTLRDLVMDFGGGTRSGRPVRAVQVGGPLGAYLPHDLLDVPMEYEALAEAGGLLGQAGSWSMTTPSTWRRRRASPWSSAHSNHAGSALRVASARRAVSRPSTRSWPGSSPPRIFCSCTTCVTL